MDHAAFPTDETLAAFNDGRLDPETRKRVVEHMTTCSGCHDTFLTASECADVVKPIDSSAGSTDITPARFGRWRELALAATITTAVTVPVVFRESIRLRYDDWSYRRQGGITALVSAANNLNYRTVELHLGGNYAYKPVKSPTRGFGRAAADADKWALYEAAAAIARAVERDRSVDNLHALGTSYLLIGEHREALGLLNEAIVKETGEDDVARALQRSSGVSLLIDFAVAYHWHATQSRERSDLTLAYEAIGRASVLRPNDPVILFNRAAILESLQMREEAAATWERYLQLDPSSPWAVEARKKLTALRRQSAAERPSDVEAMATVSRSRMSDVVAHAPQQARQYVEETLMAEWADAIFQNASAAGELKLARARAIAESLRRVTTDAMTLDAVRAIETATPFRRRALARGHLAYAAARKAFLTDTSVQTKIAFEEAADLFADGGSPLAARARMYALTVGHYTGDSRGTIEGATSMLALPSVRQYAVLVGQLYWIRALAASSLGRPGESLADYEAALMSFIPTRETSNLVGIHSNLFDTLRHIGKEKEAWPHALDALHFAERYATTERHRILLSAITRTAVDRRLMSMARLLTDRAAKLERSSDSSWFRAEIDFIRCLAAVAANDASAARKSLNAAKSAVRSIPASGTRARMEARLTLQDARLALETDSRAAIVLADEAISRFEALDDRFHAIEAFAVRADAHIRSGHDGEAEVDLREGLREIERTLLTLRSVMDRGAYVAFRREYYERLIALVGRRNPQEAFRLVDRYRGRLEDESGWLRVGRDEALIVYFTLPTRTLAWVVSNGSIAQHELPVSSPAIQRLALEIRAGVESQSMATERLSRGFEILIRPLMPLLRGRQTLFIAPDGALNDVPFSALYDARNRRFLVDDFILSIVQNSGALVAPAPIPPKSLVVVSDAMNRAWARLPASIGDTAAVEKIVPVKYNLRAEAATPKALLEALRNADGFHFAGHAEANHSFPKYSALVLTPQPDRRDGLLYAHEIESLDLRNLRSVILAACETAVGEQSLNGTATLGHAFMAAGAQSVVATLWPIQDAAASGVMRDLYRGIEGERSIRRALNETQRAAIRSGLPPVVWAAYQHYGGR